MKKRTRRGMKMSKMMNKPINVTLIDCEYIEYIVSRYSKNNKKSGEK